MALENYKMGWLFVCFDLPVKEEHQRKAATAFRKYLLDDGFQMLQFSVYIRPCVTFARQHTHIQRIKAIIPLYSLTLCEKIIKGFENGGDRGRGGGR